VIVNPDLYEKYRVVINREKFLRSKASCRIRIIRSRSRLPACYPFRLRQPRRNPMISTSCGACFRFARSYDKMSTTKAVFFCKASDHLGAATRTEGRDRHRFYTPLRKERHRK